MKRPRNIREGAIELNFSKIAAESTIVRLWAGDAPMPDDLLGQMDQPFQYLNEAKMWGIREILLPLSDSLVMISPSLSRCVDRPPDVPEMAEGT